jgi:hypothetical protein
MYTPPYMRYKPQTSALEKQEGVLVLELERLRHTMGFTFNSMREKRNNGVSRTDLK